MVMELVQEEEAEKELMGDEAGEEKGNVPAFPGCSPWPFPPSTIMAHPDFCNGSPRKKSTFLSTF